MGRKKKLVIRERVNPTEENPFNSRERVIINKKGVVRMKAYKWGIDISCFLFRHDKTAKKHRKRYPQVIGILDIFIPPFGKHKRKNKRIKIEAFRMFFL
jgi:hypothetical protein